MFYALLLKIFNNTALTRRLFSKCPWNLAARREQIVLIFPVSTWYSAVHPAVVLFQAMSHGWFIARHFVQWRRTRVMGWQITDNHTVNSTTCSGVHQKLRVTDTCEVNSPVTDGFPSQRASYTENVSVPWRHYKTAVPEPWIHLSWSLVTWQINMACTLGPAQNGRHFTDNNFKGIFLNKDINFRVKFLLNIFPRVHLTNHIDSGISMAPKGWKATTWAYDCQYLWRHRASSDHGGLEALHYSDATMGTMASQITSLSIVYSTVYSGADQRKHQSSVSLAFVRGNSPVTGEFPARMASNAENVSIWWHHHDIVINRATINPGWTSYRYVRTNIRCIFRWKILFSSDNFLVSTTPLSSLLCSMSLWLVLLHVWYA